VVQRGTPMLAEAWSDDWVADDDEQLAAIIVG